MFEPKVRHLFEVPLRTCFSNQAMMKLRLMVSKLRSAVINIFGTFVIYIIKYAGIKSQLLTPRVLYNPFNHLSLHWNPSFGWALFFNLIGLITVFDTILTGRQNGQKLQCLYGNPIANNIFQNWILRNLWIVTLYQVEDCIHQVWRMELS